jgi:hypothetical protein
MPTIGIKWEELPDSGNRDVYYVRMRVVSTDENRTSYWVYAKVEGKDWDNLKKKGQGLQSNDPVV